MATSTETAGTPLMPLEKRLIERAHPVTREKEQLPALVCLQACLTGYVSYLALPVLSAEAAA